MSKAGVSEKWNNDYEPYKNRHPTRGLSKLDSIQNLVKGCLGTGIFALPEAFYFLGMLNGIACVIFVTFFAMYCCHVMIRSQYYLCKYKRVGLLTYAEAMEVAFEVGPAFLKKYARLAWHMTNIVFALIQIGSLCVYFLFIVENIEAVGNQYAEKPIHIFIYTCSLLPICLGVICIQNMKILSPLSFLANVITVVTVIVLCYYVSSDLPKFTSRPSFRGEFKLYPLAFGTVLFALHSVVVIITIENNMIEPQHFLAPFGVLHIGMGSVSIIYMTVGIMGYWKYGQEIVSSILLNFPDEDILAQLIRILYSLALIVSYALYGIVLMSVLWDNYFIPKFEQNQTSQMKQIICNYSLRTAICVITLIIALFMPFLGLIISVIGGVCLSLVGIIFPGILEICALWPDGFGVIHWVFWKDIVIIVFGTLVTISCMFSFVDSLIIELQHHEDNS